MSTLERAMAWLVLASMASGASVALLIGAPTAEAAIPEPDHLFYGVVLENGSPLLGAPIELRLGGATGEVLASGFTGSGTSATDLYLLTVLVDAPATPGEERTPGVARMGDITTLLAQGMPVAQLIIGGRGLFARVDVDLGVTGTIDPDAAGGDLDADGVANYLDNCLLPNANQLDTNGDGVGDACEGITNATGALFDVSAPAGVNGSDPTTGYGAVEYDFQAADTEVTNAQYREMLAAVADLADPHGLYNARMASDPRGGIRREGAPGAWSYALKPNMADKPVNFVSWLDAARYANWLFNGQPQGIPGPTTTEAGTIDLAVPDPALNAIPADVLGPTLLTEDEWYKAAYFDPALDAYWRYPTRSDSEPLTVVSDGTGAVVNPGPERVNYASSADWNGLDGHVVTVGSAGAVSAYGGYDMAGNVWEWTAAQSEGNQRVVRGGSYQDDRFSIEAIADGDRSLLLRDPGYEGADVGLRVGVVLSVPEPGLVYVLALGGLGLVGLSRRRI